MKIKVDSQVTSATLNKNTRIALVQAAFAAPAAEAAWTNAMLDDLPFRFGRAGVPRSGTCTPHTSLLASSLLPAYRAVGRGVAANGRSGLQ